MTLIDNHVCKFCFRRPDEDGFSTTYDYNNCDIAASIMYRDEVDDETKRKYARYVKVKWEDNNREFEDMYNPQLGVVFKTEDNGGGYNITRCPAFKLDYAKYIKSEEWKEKREDRLFLDGYKCRFCGSAINIVVHHVTYDNVPNEDMTDLVSLCKTCHNKLHEFDNTNKKNLSDDYQKR